MARTPEKTYRIGLALSGGGAKGFAHAGVLKALEAYGIVPDIIAGTSAGAIVGALYADGFSPEEVLRFFDSASFSRFAKLTHRKGGLFRIDEFKKALKEALRAQTFEELRLPLYINATDMHHARNVYFSQGPLLDVIIASCSLPILFEPIVLDDVAYCDGGIIRNFPVDILRHQCTYVIGVNLGAMDMEEKSSLSLIDVAQRTYSIMRKANVLTAKEDCDILIEPDDLDHFGLFDAENSKKIYQAGYDEAMRVLQASPDFIQHMLHGNV